MKLIEHDQFNTIHDIIHGKLCPTVANLDHLITKVEVDRARTLLGMVRDDAISALSLLGEP